MSKSLNFPLQHISIRVPWHDAGWTGTVCSHPKLNSACLKLKNIAESKNEEDEEAIAGQSFKDLPEDRLPPCMKERGAFMAPFAVERHHEHPYAKNTNGIHSHFRPTRMRYPAYSAAALPFLWMRKPVVFGYDERTEETNAVPYTELYPLEGVSLDHEPTEDELGFKSHWFQAKANHEALLDCFWNHVKPEESLVFFYAKQVPLVEDTGKRVLIAVGRVKAIGALQEYQYEDLPEDGLRSLLWERMVSHSIRPDFADGFIMPYHAALEHCDEGRAFDPAEVVAFAPEDRFIEFSFATEHVSHDAAIAALLSMREALHRSADRFPCDIIKQEHWIDRELGRLWKKRGAFPGMGAVLSATGVGMGHFIAQVIQDEVGESGDPWKQWHEVLKEPKKALPKELARHVDVTIAKAWRSMPAAKHRFLELLSRIDLNADQAGLLVESSGWPEAGIHHDRQDFLKNPYLIYECTRLQPEPIGLAKVDQGVFATSFIRQRFPVPEPSAVATPVDARRIRAMVIHQLERAALEGHTLLTSAGIIQGMRGRKEEEGELSALVTEDILRVVEMENFPGEVRVVETARGEAAYQLDRLADVGQLIRQTVLKRVEGNRHEVKAEWGKMLDRALGALPKAKGERVTEERARAEKEAVLEEIAAARFSVLIGPAGTGKTTLLSVLCLHPDVSAGGILLLAPTGKARVRMESVIKDAGVQNITAQTIAQFLSAKGRYDGSVGRYQLLGEKANCAARTVIVDECSMLTEEMMAALFEALGGVHRLILVGDHRQLPPIGAGRPFVDIISQLRPDDVESRFPRVAASYAELTVTRRQGSTLRDDLLLAQWFGGADVTPGEDSIFELLSGQRKSDTLQFVQWDSPEDLERKLPEVLASALEFPEDKDPKVAFDLSLGASEYNGFTYFRPSGKWNGAEAWQILSPVRQKPWGVDVLNRAIHERYRAHFLLEARKGGRYQRFLKPQGEDQIVYGDKVINLRNHKVWKGKMYPKPEAGGYLANGEIGMVVGQMRTKKYNVKPTKLQVEFSTQIGQTYEFYASDFKEDGDSDLSLAYALTVHKAQGSEFGVVFLVLPRSPLLLSRELLYTALTRQKQKVVVLHQGTAAEVQALSSEVHSSAAQRMTNLFQAPKLVEVKVDGKEKRFLEERLMHVTSKGDAVRSKSEVIIADKLSRFGLAYQYEQPLQLAGTTKYPDFTIEDDDAGVTYYWEHCGMLMDPTYAERWEKKKAWYRAQGILPHTEGGGKKGTLIVTEDDERGGFNSAAIDKLIKQVFHL